VKLIMTFGITVGLLMVSLGLQCAAWGAPQGKTSHQHFVCNTGYTLEKCRKDMAILQRALEKYPVSDLGEWTWVLVRSADWRAIQTPRGLHPNSPAFTYYLGKETFVEEALVSEVPGRCLELKSAWGMNIEILLDYAIAHELGHALCHERNEAQADRVAKSIREGNAASCEVNLQAKRRLLEDLRHSNSHGAFK
jgi:hypothetical protein